jgi:predicted secreted protein
MIFGRGTHFRLFMENPNSPGNFVIVAACRSTSFSQANSSLDVSKADGGRFRKLIPGGQKTISMSFDGIFTDHITAEWVMGKVWNTRKARFKLTDSIGNIIISDFFVSGYSNHGGLFSEQGFSFSLSSTTRPFIYTPPFGPSGDISKGFVGIPMAGFGGVPGGLPSTPEYTSGYFTDLGTIISGAGGSPGGGNFWCCVGVFNVSDTTLSPPAANVTSGISGLGGYLCDPDGIWSSFTGGNNLNKLGLWYFYISVIQSGLSITLATSGGSNTSNIDYNVVYNGLTTACSKRFDRIQLQDAMTTVDLYAPSITGSFSNQFNAQSTFLFSGGGAYTSTNYGTHNFYWAVSIAGNNISVDWSNDSSSWPYPGLGYEILCSLLTVDMISSLLVPGAPNPVGNISGAIASVQYGPWPSGAFPNLQLGVTN